MKTRRIVLFVLLLLWFNEATAQYINRVYTLNSYYGSGFGGVIEKGGKYYCIGMVYDSSGKVGSTTYSGIKMAVLDSLGNILKDTVFQMPPVRNYTKLDNAFFETPDGGFVASVEQDYDSLFHLGIIKFDSLANIQWVREDSPTVGNIHEWSTGINDLKPTSAGELLELTSNVRFRGGPDSNVVMLSKLDSNFKTIWNRKFYYPLGWEYRAVELNVLPDGYLIGSNIDKTDYMTLKPVIQRAQIIRTDTDGNELWRWESNPDSLNYLAGLLQTKDGGILHYGDMGSSTNIAQKGWIEKLDSNRHTVWTDSIGKSDGELTAAIELPDGAIVVAGNAGGGLEYGDTVQNVCEGYACLIKYSEDGHKLWQRKYRYLEDTLNYMPQIYDLKATSDGGYVMCGFTDLTIYMPYNMDREGWLIKVDSNGCSSDTDPQCHPKALNVVKSSVPSNHNVTIYPNPVSNYLTISGAGNNDLTILNATGQTVTHTTIRSNKETLSVEGLVKGVYFLEFTDTVTAEKKVLEFVK